MLKTLIFSIASAIWMVSIVSALSQTNPALHFNTLNLTCFNQSTSGGGENTTNVFTWYKNGVLNASSGVMNGTAKDEGLIVWLPMANDLYDYAFTNDGTNNFAVYNLSARAYNFNGSGQYVSLGDVHSVENTTDLSVSAWVKIVSTNEGTQNIVNKYRSS